MNKFKLKYIFLICFFLLSCSKDEFVEWGFEMPVISCTDNSKDLGTFEILISCEYISMARHGIGWNTFSPTLYVEGISAEQFFNDNPILEIAFFRGDTLILDTSIKWNDIHFEKQNDNLYHCTDTLFIQYPNGRGICVK